MFFVLFTVFVLLASSQYSNSDDCYDDESFWFYFSEGFQLRNIPTNDTEYNRTVEWLSSPALNVSTPLVGGRRKRGNITQFRYKLPILRKFDYNKLSTVGFFM